MNWKNFLNKIVAWLGLDLELVDTANLDVSDPTIHRFLLKYDFPRGSMFLYVRCDNRTAWGLGQRFQFYFPTKHDLATYPNDESWHDSSRLKSILDVWDSFYWEFRRGASWGL